MTELKTTASPSFTRSIVVLVICHLAVAILFGTWHQSQEVTDGPKDKVQLDYPVGESASFWKAIDSKVFLTLNGSLEENRSAQTFWAIANNRAFDLVMAVLMGILLWFFVFRKATAEEKLERIKVSIFLAIITVIFIQLFHFTIFYFARMSPSLVFKSEAIRLTTLEHVTWKLKDATMHSFPGDHATVLFIITALITYFAGKRAGAVALGMAIFCALPRMVAGAHWFTDIAVGSVSLALVAVSWGLCTRHWKFGPNLLQVPSLFLMGIVGRILPSFRPPESLVASDTATATESDTMSETPEHKKRNLKENLYLFFSGACMGAADIVPGVSGGTMAFILGIYEELLDAIKSFNVKLLRLALGFKIKQCFDHVPWKFLLVLGSGLLITLKLLADVVHGVLGDPVGKVYLYGFFFGLVVASILTLSRHVKWRLDSIVAFILGTLVAWFIVGLVPAEMPHTAPYIFFSGMIAIMAMILPGISGSFILLILGQYAFVVGALKDLDFKVFAIFGVGAAIGLLGFSRVLSWLLKHFHAITIAALIGFMTGSLRKIWPFKDTENTTFVEDRHGDLIPIMEPNQLPDFSSQQWWITLGLAIGGAVLILALEGINARMNRSPESK